MRSRGGAKGGNDESGEGEREKEQRQPERRNRAQFPAEMLRCESPRKGNAALTGETTEQF